jgi:peptide/nickel transport system permease protein
VSTAGIAEAVGLRPAEAAAPRLVRRVLRRPLAIVSLLYIALIVGIAIIAPIVLPNVSNQQAGDLAHVMQGPSWQHLLGTDSVGRDVLARLLVGTRITILGVAEATLVAVGLGVPLGLAAGYVGGWCDRAVGWWTDLSLAMPALAIALVVLTVFPDSMAAAMVTIGALGAAWIIRVVRSATLGVSQELYIAAARVAGLSRTYILTRHVLPRIVGPFIVVATLFAAGTLLTEAGLSYLGLVAAVPTPSWGGMITDGIANLVVQPWLIWPPGLAIVLTTIAFGVLADEVTDANIETWAPTSAVRGQRRPTQSQGSSEDAPPKVAADALLAVEDVTITLPSPSRPIDVVAGVRFDIRVGETVGLVGESGCGKTVTGMALLGLVPGGGMVTGGRIVFDGRDLSAMGDGELRRVRGREIGIVSQEPRASLNPVFRVGWQVALAVRRHQGVGARAAEEQAVELLRMVHLPEPEAVARRYPHELSGGMAQRVAIARALAGEPRLLIADEPTTALDVTVQAEILDLLRELKRTRNMAILLITHDWGVIADICDRAIVMYAGQVVERASVTALFREPMHPYTMALLDANPHRAPTGGLLPAIPGAVPRPGEWPAGCHFHTRCAYATSLCGSLPIPLERPEPGRETRCIRYTALEERSA